MKIRLQTQDDAGKVDALLDLTFGEDRFNKAAYALREGVLAIDDLSFVISDGEQLIGTLRFWPINIGGKQSLLLGPIAIDPKKQGSGFGINLMKHGLMTAEEIGYQSVVLVGDETYYQKIGFSRALATNLIMEGQHDQSRLLAQELVPGALKDIQGQITKT
jgi:predicted N-acetyltransferase YhbS